MEKMRMESVDITSENIKKIGELFPNCITETVDEHGKSRKAINFDILRQMLSGDVNEGDEAYEFTWVGKKAAIVEANKPIRKTLRPCKEESVDWDNTENLYIEGDNLEVLKLLQESYLGKVNLIYIDPPYNTGNDFIYNDDFSMSLDEYVDGINQINENGYRMFRNTDSNGKFHSDWCSMIYSRLLLARTLLSDDGVIFISIDDNEQENLKKICDEVFGESNFIAEFFVASNSSKNNAKFVSISHEYMLCYAKNKIAISYEWKVKKNSADEFERRAMSLISSGMSFEEIHQELLGLVKYPRFYDFDHYTYADKQGVFRTDNAGGVANGNFTTEIYHPITKMPCSKPSGGWRYKEEEIERMLKEGMFYFGEDETTIPQPKRYLKDYIYQVPKSLMFFDSQSSTKWLKNEKIPFDFPKSVDLLKHIISIIPSDAIILDFFSGSATTAHAIMQLNAEDGGNRKFIMVQIPEEIEDKNNAYKNGYKTICDIGKARIRKAAVKIQEENPESRFDKGFRVLKLDDSNMKQVYYAADEYNQSSLEDFISNIKEDRTDMDLFFACLLEWGLPLSMPYEFEIIETATIHIYNEGDLIACFDENISEEVMKRIANKQPLRVVFREACFANSPEKINLFEHFKLISPDTSIKVI